MPDAGVQYPKMINKRKGIYVHLPKYETIEGYKHIGLDEKGVPYIQGTTMKVVELVVENTVYKWNAEELQVQHPYLTLSQIHSALSYYHDHKDEIDNGIERRRRFAEEMRKKVGPSPLAAKLKSVGLICYWPDRTFRKTTRSEGFL
jgi:uncharacterized protein (DUF433 family)